MNKKKSYAIGDLKRAAKANMRERSVELFNVLEFLSDVGTGRIKVEVYRNKKRQRNGELKPR